MNTPTVIRAETKIFGLCSTEWYVINSLLDTPGKCRVSKREAKAIIKAFALPLAHKDEAGEIYADACSCFAPYLLMKKLCRADSNDLQNEQKKITQFLKLW